MNREELEKKKFPCFSAPLESPIIILSSTAEERALLSECPLFRLDDEHAVVVRLDLHVRRLRLRLEELGRVGIVGVVADALLSLLMRSRLIALNTLAIRHCVLLRRGSVVTPCQPPYD
jgi:hypothetical protein